MKVAVISVRILMGLLFLLASITYFFKLIPPTEMNGDVKVFNEGLASAIYLMPLLKIFELVCSIAFLTGRYVALATIIIFPIVLNIFLFHFFLAPEGLIIAFLLLFANLFLAYAYRKHYVHLLISNRIS